MTETQRLKLCHVAVAPNRRRGRGCLAVMAASCKMTSQTFEVATSCRSFPLRLPLQTVDRRGEGTCTHILSALAFLVVERPKEMMACSSSHRTDADWVGGINFLSQAVQTYQMLDSNARHFGWTVNLRHSTSAHTMTNWSFH